MMRAFLLAFLLPTEALHDLDPLFSSMTVPHVRSSAERENREQELPVSSKKKKAADI